MKKLETIKTVGGVIVAVGISTIVGDAVKNVAPVGKYGVVKRLCVAAGALVLSSMLSDKGVTYTENKIDEAVSGAKKIIEETEGAV